MKNKIKFNFYLGESFLLIYAGCGLFHEVIGIHFYDDRKPELEVKDPIACSVSLYNVFKKEYFALCKEYRKGTKKEDLATIYEIVLPLIQDYAKI